MECTNLIKRLRCPVVFLLFMSLMGCKNPLGTQDTRDSSFSPGGGGSGDNPSDTIAPSPASNLSLVSSWVTGNLPAQSPIFSWTNPSDEDFDKAQVALGITPGGEEVVPFSDSLGGSSHTFSGLNFAECTTIYYPSVKAFDTTGNESTAVTETLGFRYDNTNPFAVGSLTIPSHDATSSYTVTVDWSGSPGSDNCGIDHYEIALGYDDDSDGFDSGDLNNLIDWSDVPGGNTVTSYQIQDGVNGFIFSSDFNRQYYISIRVVDSAGLTSNATSSSGWYTFHPTQINNLEVWLDSQVTTSLFQDSGCSTTPATLVSDPVACWMDQSGQGNHAIQTGATTPRIGATGLDFDGNDDILEVTSKTYVTSSDLSIFLFYEADTQSNNSGSCCRPIVSFATNSTGLYAWLGLTRGDFGPNNNVFHGWDGAGQSYIPTSPGDSVIMSATHDGSNALWNAYSFGVQRVTNYAISSFTSTVLGIGGDPGNAARRIAGEIYEVVIFDSIVSASERQDMEGYLACKYDARDSLDASHPYYDLIGANKTGCP